MQKWLPLFLLLCATGLYAQNTRTITRPDETYSVLESDSSIKHGPYTGYFENRPLARGSYQNGQRTGEWTFYGFDGKPAQVYDYDKRTLLYTTAVTDSIRFQVIHGSDTVWTHVDRKAEAIGGDRAIAQHLRNTIRYPERARAMGIEGKVIILVTVDETGQPVQFRISRKKLGGGCDEEAMRGFKRMKLEWVPSFKDGKPVLSIVPVTVEFKLI